jgi:ubiquinone/menaquinone biosynthesis C-methylase UbiE
MTTDELQREKKFHNQRFADDSVRSRKVARFYKLNRTIEAAYRESLFCECGDTKALELGCGTGAMALEMTESGTQVSAIDISQVALRLMKAQARQSGLEEKSNFYLMNAEKLGFTDNSFDLVFGKGILHHLDLESVIPEIKRVLRSDGQAVFIEPLGHNILINIFRRCTPGIRSVDEHPLTESDLAVLKNYFGQVDVEYFYLFALLAAPLVGLSCFDWGLDFFESVDQWLFNIPLFRRQAWQLLIKLSEPQHLS